MSHRLFTIASAISLLLVAATVVFWLASWHRTARASYYFRNGSLIDVVFLGSHFQVQVEAVHQMPGDTEGESGFAIQTWEHEDWKPTPYSYFFAGIAWGRYPSERVTTTYFGIPLWELTLIFLALPAVWFSIKSRKTHALGTCQGCGYNLVGNTSGVCPECGMPVPKKTETVA